MCVDTYVCACVYQPGLTSSAFLHHSPPNTLKQNFSLEPIELTSSTSLASLP